MAKRRYNHQGIADQLSQAICLATFLTSLGPYVSANYFPITILVFILIIAILEIYNCLQKRFSVRTTVVHDSNNNLKTRNHSPKRRLAMKKESIQKWGNQFSKRRFQSMKVIRHSHVIEVK